MRLSAFKALKYGLLGGSLGGIAYYSSDGLTDPNNIGLVRFGRAAITVNLKSRR